MGVTPHGSVELVRSGVFANIHWGLIDIGGTGDILFLIGCVRAGLVLLEAANESGTDTDGAGDGAHDILGERSGLVSADDEGIQLPSSHENREEVFLIHPFRGESERRRRLPQAGGLPEQRQQPVSLR